MIKSSFGTVELKAIMGESELLADLCVIASVMTKNGISEDEILDAVKTGIKDAKEKVEATTEEKQEYKDKLSVLVEELGELLKAGKNAL